GRTERADDEQVKLNLGPITGAEHGTVGEIVAVVLHQEGFSRTSARQKDGLQVVEIRVIRDVVERQRVPVLDVLPQRTSALPPATQLLDQRVELGLHLPAVSGAQVKLGINRRHVPNLCERRSS